MSTGANAAANGDGLRVQVDVAVLGHPAGRRRGIGFQRVELRAAETATVQIFVGLLPVERTVQIPAVYALECHGCGALFRVNSPHLLAHHETHRRHPSLARQARGLLYLAGHAVRRRLERI